MGHHSVAEHAVFNFDCMDISRLALEELKQFRLVSYTEKSQRYVTLEGDFVHAGRIEKWRRAAPFSRRGGTGERFLPPTPCAALLALAERRRPDLNGATAGRRELASLAKEDARYVLPLATCGQAGMTINARNLEHLFRRLALSRRAEVRRLSETLYELVMPVARP